MGWAGREADDPTLNVPPPVAPNAHPQVGSAKPPKNGNSELYQRHKTVEEQERRHRTIKPNSTGHRHEREKKHEATHADERERQDIGAMHMKGVT